MSGARRSIHKLVVSSAWPGIEARGALAGMAGAGFNPF